MDVNEIRHAINVRVGDALLELESEHPRMDVVRDKLCDAAQFTHFREDGSRTDCIK